MNASTQTEPIEKVDQSGSQTMRNECDTKVHDGDFISIVDMSTIICNKFNDTGTHEINELDHQMEIKFTPLMPLTVELMKRKSMYYLGLEQNIFFRLLRIITNTTPDVTDPFIEMKVMLTLRKQRLNEEFESLGDLFDIDKKTAQLYYAESKNLVAYLSSTNPAFQDSEDLKNPLWTQECTVNDEEEDEAEQQEDEEDLSASEITYKGYAVKYSDVDSADFEDYSESEDSELDEHVAKDREKCPQCQQFVSRLEHHMETVHLNPQYLNKTLCGLCFTKFQTHTSLRAHQADIHDGNSCLCDVCGKMFRTFSAVKDHILKVHSKFRPFLCHFCAASFQSRSKLKVHTDSSHLQIRRFACNLCEKKYFQGNQLQNHVRSVHTKEKRFKCRFKGCNKSFCRSSSWSTHEQMHKFNFFCEICSKIFTFRQNLQTHCRNVHGMNVSDTEKCKIEINK